VCCKIQGVRRWLAWCPITLSQAGAVEWTNPYCDPHPSYIAFVSRQTTLLYSSCKVLANHIININGHGGKYADPWVIVSPYLIQVNYSQSTERLMDHPNALYGFMLVGLYEICIATPSRYRFIWLENNIWLSFHAHYTWLFIPNARSIRCGMWLLPLTLWRAWLHPLVWIRDGFHFQLTRITPARVEDAEHSIVLPT
jgi:hypothetical protein